MKTLLTVDRNVGLEVLDRQARKSFTNSVHHHNIRQRSTKIFSFEPLETNLLKVLIDFTRAIRPSNFHKCPQRVTGKDPHVAPPANQ